MRNWEFLKRNNIEHPCYRISKETGKRTLINQSSMDKSTLKEKARLRIINANLSKAVTTSLLKELGVC